MQKFNQFKIYVKPFNIDLLTGMLWELEILGINEFDDHVEVFTDDKKNITSKEIVEILESLKVEKIIQEYDIHEEIVENKNWNEEWEKKINVIEVSERIVIKPSFREYSSSKDQIIITIDPKMSFGTGEHQTTRIMLQLLEKYFKKSHKILDVGSGTAILSIAAAKLGASKVFAVDNDEWCYVNGKENIDRNQVNNVQVMCGTIEKVIDNDFDIVLANINKNVLLEIKKELLEKTNTGGFIIISGILESDLEEIKRQFTQLGLTALEFQQLDEWIGFIFKKA